jgi:Phage portal protein, SPP1 Gp6-like
VANPGLSAIYDDVEKGLAAQQHRLNDCAMSQAFWDYRGKRFMQVFLRDAETPFDFVARPYRMAGLVRQIVTILCEHLYSPGPSRTWSEPEGDEFLKRVYADNHFDAMMLRADQLSTLNDVAAIQVDADEGVWQDRPVTLRLWSAADFHAWTDPGNRTEPRVACTIDRFEEKDVYRVWTETDVRTYETRKDEQLAGGRAARLIGQEDHDYGCLPFAFVHAEQPITTFWETGIGGMLTQAEIRMNDRLSRLDESINKHLNPLPVAEGVDDNFQVIMEPQRFLKLRGAQMRPGASGGMEDGPPPRLYYLSPTIDVAGAWDDLLKYLNQVLEAMRVPIAAVRMEQAGIESGIALVVEQAPLLTRARARRRPFSLYETNIGRTILRCSGNHYGNAGLVAAAKKGTLALGWPQPSVPVPTPDNLDLLLKQVYAGFKSLPMAVSEWSGVDREGAFQVLEQVEKDNAELKRRAPNIAAKLEPPKPDDDEEDEPGDGGVNASDDDNPTRDTKEMVMDL